MKGDARPSLDESISTELAGKVVMVTGASRGLGKHLAQRFHQLGAKVVGVARDPVTLEALRHDLAPLPEQKHSHLLISADISKPDAGDLLLKETRDSFGRLDVLICNAAVQGPIGPLWSIDRVEWASTITINLVAQAALAASAVPLMLKQGNGRIIFVSGGGATSPRPGFSAYAAAKAGLVRLAETLAVELRGTGVTVNAIAPGAMPTDMLKQVLDAGTSQAGSAEIAGATRAMRDTEQVIERAVKLCLFLALDASREISGKLISAVWDRYENWPAHADELASSDAYTIRRIVGRDRGYSWGDR